MIVRKPLWLSKDEAEAIMNWAQAAPQEDYVIFETLKDLVEAFKSE